MRWKWETVQVSVKWSACKGLSNPNAISVESLFWPRPKRTKLFHTHRTWVATFAWAWNCLPTKTCAGISTKDLVSSQVLRLQVLKRISPMKDRADMMWRWWSGPDCKVWCKAVGGNVSGWTPPSFGTAAPTGATQAPIGGTEAPIQDHISSMEPIIGPECFLAYHCHVGTFLLPENIWPIIYHRSDIHFWWQTCAQTICHLTTVKSDVWGVLESMEGKVASQRTSFFHHQLVRHVAKLRREEEWKTILLANTRIWVHIVADLGKEPGFSVAKSVKLPAVRSANMAKVCEVLNICCWSFSHRVALQHNSTLSLHLVGWVFRTGWSTAVGSAPKSHWHALPLIDHRTRSCQFLTNHNQPLSR